MGIEFGAKAQNLIRLANDFGLNVPEFEAIPFAWLIANYEQVCARLVRTVNDYLAGNLELAETDSRLKAELAGARVNRERIDQYVLQLRENAWGRVSYRTSAALEDGETHSFAGQYESFLDIDFGAESLEKYALECFACMVAPKVINYARERGIRAYRIGGSLIVQKMFYGKAAGVLFTENGSGQIHIAFTRSWRNSVVEGEDAEEILVDRAGIAEAKLPWQLRELCHKALEIEYATETPVDIEWAYNGQSLAFLQFRPITQKALEYRFDWDSTNISENYPGITLPLTYSVIRQFYAGVYLAFFKMLGASEKDVKAKAHIADNMLGYLNGRVYYRISNWYEAVKLVPGRRNQEFFEAMLNPVKKRGGARRARLDLRSIWALGRFTRLLLSSECISRRFSRSIAKKIAFYDAIDFGYINASAILEASKRLRVEILTDWAVTILNDVRLMVFHGLLKRAYRNNQNPNDYLALMQGLTDRTSIRPLEELTKLGKVVAAAMTAENVSSPADLAGTGSWGKVKAAAATYISAYGARTPGELKLENERISDQLETVLELALKAGESGISAAPHSGQRNFVWPQGMPRISRGWVLWVAKNTRSAIDWRERFRFNRAQTFNLSRKAFDAIGALLASEGIIETARDIYWLTDAEVDELVNGHSPVLSGKAAVALRKAEYAEYEKLDQALAVSGAGLIAGAHLHNVEAADAASGLSGNGVAPGEVTAEAIVVREFDPNIDVRGKVLVVHYIDPGWTLLFTQAAAIVAERGNALSHAAIIAREIGIPAVVAAPTATRDIQTGQVITVNGTTGSIRHEAL